MRVLALSELILKRVLVAATGQLKKYRALKLE
jgi:hypothetical protein